MRKIVLVAVALIAASSAASEITVKSVVDEMNARRSEAGLPALRADERLTDAADDRMRDMEERSYWAHVSPEGRRPFEWLRPRGYDFYYAGENLAAGFETTRLLVDSWMESKGHRENIMSPIYQDCGVAILDGSTVKRATGRSVVVLFGRLKTNP
jgi:uncharacterized protein YkwD